MAKQIQKKALGGGVDAQEDPKKKAAVSGAGPLTKSTLPIKDDAFFTITSNPLSSGDIRGMGYKEVIPKSGIYKNPEYDPKAAGSAEYVSYKAIPKEHPLYDKKTGTAHGFFSVPDPFKPKTVAPVVAPSIASTEATPTSINLNTPAPQTQKIWRSNYNSPQGQVNVYSMPDGSIKHFLPNGQELAPTGKAKGGLVAKYSTGGWVDNNGQPVNDNDVNFNFYSDKDRIALGYKRTGQNQGNTTGQNFAKVGKGIGAAGLAYMASKSQNTTTNPDGTPLTQYQKEQQDGNNLNSAADAGISQIPGFGQYYGLAKAGEGIGRGMVKRDAKGNPVNDNDQIADNFMTSTHEQVLGDLSHKRYGSALADVFINKGVGAIAGKFLGNKSAIGKKVNDWSKSNNAPDTTEEDKTKLAVANQYNPNYTGMKKGGIVEMFMGGETPGREPMTSTYNFAKKNGGLVQMCSEGGEIVGRGTGTSDSISAKVKGKSFIVPKKNATAAKTIKEEVLQENPNKKANLKQKGGEEIKVSDGEVIFTEQEVEKLAAMGIDINALAPEAKVKYKKEFSEGGPVDGSDGGADPYANVYKVSKKEAAISKLADKYVKAGKTPKQARYSAEEEYKSGYISPTKGGNGLVNKFSAKPSKGKSLVERMSAAETMYPNETADLTNNNTEISGLKDLYKPTKGEYSKALQEKYGITPKIADTSVNGIPSSNTAKSKGAFDYDLGAILGIGQTAFGAGLLAKNNKRPAYDTTPEFKSQLAATIAASKYGYTPAQQSLLEQEAVENRNTQNAAIASASGGNGAVALNNLRAAGNDYYKNRLQNASEDESLRISKMNNANNMANVNESFNRQKFTDKLNAFQQNQGAAAGLLSSGIENLIGASRYRNSMLASQQMDRLDSL